MTREEALAIAEDRKAARRLRTSRIRVLVATAAAAAFIGPFAVIYGHVAAGKDPALAAQTSVARVVGSTTTSISGSSASGGSTTSPSGSTGSDTTSSDDSTTT